MDVDGYLSAEDLEALKIFLPFNIHKSLALFKYLAASNRFTTFPIVFVALKISLTMSVTVE